MVELGAGTGKLTADLVARDHLVLATDPDERMLHRLRRRIPDAFAAVGTAERIPVAHRSADVVVVAQAFHWFDHPVAVPEMARVLRPGGVLALVWNQRDESIPWVKRLGRLIGSQDQRDDPAGRSATTTSSGRSRPRRSGTGRPSTAPACRTSPPPAPTSPPCPTTSGPRCWRRSARSTTPTAAGTRG